MEQAAISGFESLIHEIIKADNVRKYVTSGLHCRLRYTPPTSLRFCAPLSAYDPQLICQYSAPMCSSISDRRTYLSLPLLAIPQTSSPKCSRRKKNERQFSDEQFPAPTGKLTLRRCPAHCFDPHDTSIRVNICDVTCTATSGYAGRTGVLAWLSVFVGTHLESESSALSLLHGMGKESV